MASAGARIEHRDMSIGRVFQHATSTVGHNPLLMIGLALAGALPNLLIARFQQTVFPFAHSRDRLVEVAVIAPILVWLANTAIGAFVQAGLIQAVVAQGDGRRANLRDCIAAGFRFFLPLAAVGVLFVLAMLIGLVMLVVPAIVVIVIWSVASPAVVIERSGVFAAFSRSRDLTRGSRWKILGLLLIIGLCYLIAPTFVALLGFGSFSGVKGINLATSTSVPLIAVNVFATAALHLLWGTVQPALFIELREAKEGSGTDSLSDIFA